ncbi:unnamed protein product [Moneuplotes crassus]|uniref:Uncharacterized protein n=1 Tax=Euplotes crassus TaxID=5936 RepID=A0AAD1XDR5_EUPCR|nr:unnamed protein product [Moneuplotes crassus]
MSIAKLHCFAPVIRRKTPRSSNRNPVKLAEYHSLTQGITNSSQIRYPMPIQNISSIKITLSSRKEAKPPLKRTMDCPKEPRISSLKAKPNCDSIRSRSNIKEPQVCVSDAGQNLQKMNSDLDIVKPSNKIKIRSDPERRNIIQREYMPVPKKRKLLKMENRTHNFISQLPLETPAITQQDYCDVEDNILAILKKSDEKRKKKIKHIRTLEMIKQETCKYSNLRLKREKERNNSTSVMSNKSDSLLSPRRSYTSNQNEVSTNHSYQNKSDKKENQRVHCGQDLDNLLLILVQNNRSFSS